MNLLTSELFYAKITGKDINASLYNSPTVLGRRLACIDSDMKKKRNFTTKALGKLIVSSG